MINNSRLNQVDEKGLFETDAFKKCMENLSKAYINTLNYGVEVELLRNSKSEGFLDHMVGEKGVVLSKVKRQRINGYSVVDYIVMFGELTVIVNSRDLKLPEREL